MMRVWLRFIIFFVIDGGRFNVIVTMMPFQHIRRNPNNPLFKIKNRSRNPILWTGVSTTCELYRDDWPVWVDQLFKITSPVESVANCHLIWFSFHPRTFTNAHFICYLPLTYIYMTKHSKYRIVHSGIWIWNKKLNNILHCFEALSQVKLAT